MAARLRTSKPDGLILTHSLVLLQAAMPSLHFGYSFLIGLTIASLPISTSRLSTLSSIPSPTPSTHRLQTTVFRRIPSPTRLLRSRRTLLVALGLSYPFVILAAIVATANHFVLDAVAGAIVCGIAWRGQTALLNLLPLEDYFLALVRVHKPAVMGERPVEEES